MEMSFRDRVNAILTVSHGGPGEPGGLVDFGSEENYQNVLAQITTAHRESICVIDTEAKRCLVHDWRGNFIVYSGRVQGKGTCAKCGADLQETLLAAAQ